MSESCKHRRTVRRSLPVFLLFGLGSGVSLAATDSLELDTLVVTGTRTERTLLDVPVRTQVISQQELQSNHARDLADALRNQPGVLLRDIHGKNGKEVWLQGLDSDRVLVLIDGRPVSASTGSTVDLTQIATADVDRIEIVKGAVSALYGSSAMGGVINVITRNPDAPLDWQLTLDTGSHGSDRQVEGSVLDQRHLSAGVSVAQSRVEGSLSLDVRDTDGFDLEPSTFDSDGERGSRITLAGDVALHLSDSQRIEYSTNWYEEDLESDFSVFTPGQGDILKLDAEYVTRFNQTLSWQGEFGAGRSLKAWLMQENFDDRTRQDTLSTSAIDQQRDARIETLKAEVQFDLPLGSDQHWTLGGNLFDSSLRQQQQRAEGERELQIDEIEPGAGHRSAEFFVQNSILAGERWEIIPGLRLQEDSDFGGHLAPKVNIMFVPDFLAVLEPRLRLGLGKGYRVPNLKERYYLFDHSANGYVVLGNEQLQPEENDSIQLGFEMSVDQSTRGELALFYNRISNLISTSVDEAASDESDLQVFRYSNIAEARTQGIELSLVQHFSPTLTLNAAYTWLDSLDRGTGLALIKRPEHQLDVGLDWRMNNKGSQLIFKAAWQSDEFADEENLVRSPGYTTLNLRFNQPVGKQFKWFLGVDNLLDEYREPGNEAEDFRPSEGRFVYTGLRYSLL